MLSCYFTSFFPCERTVFYCGISPGVSCERTAFYRGTSPGVSCERTAFYCGISPRVSCERKVFYRGISPGVSCERTVFHRDISPGFSRILCSLGWSIIKVIIISPGIPLINYSLSYTYFRNYPLILTSVVIYQEF